MDAPGAGVIVAIHQPNYFPWLGYFSKIATSDVFVFLDDVQFSKGSYTNRVQITVNGSPVWITVPVFRKLGTLVGEVAIAQATFARSHADRLKQAYKRAANFGSAWEVVGALLDNPTPSLAEFNATAIKVITANLGLSTRFVLSSSLGVQDASSDVRLAEIVAKVAPGGVYLSGAGGAKYQAPESFANKGIRLQYTTFQVVPYARSGEGFVPGLSILDALFHLGFEGTAKLLRDGRPRS